MEKFEKMEANTIGRETLELFKQRKGFMNHFKIEKKQRLEENDKFGLYPVPTKEAMVFQEEALTNLYSGKQQTIAFKKVNVSEIEK